MVDIMVDSNFISCPTCTFKNDIYAEKCQVCESLLDPGSNGSNNDDTESKIYNELYNQLMQTQLSQQSQQQSKPSSQLTNDQSIDPDVLQQMISANEHKEALYQNYVEANNIIPESFFHVDMLYLPMKINDVEIKALVDTGAQVTIMSKACAIKCGLIDMIDHSINGHVIGVGEQNVLGKIWMVDIMFKDNALPCSFTVLENLEYDVIFGLNMMITHRCTIDLDKKCLRLGEYEVPFVKLEEDEDPSNE